MSVRSAALKSSLDHLVDDSDHNEPSGVLHSDPSRAFFAGQCTFEKSCEVTNDVSN